MRLAGKIFYAVYTLCFLLLWLAVIIIDSGIDGVKEFLEDFTY